MMSLRKGRRREGNCRRGLLQGLESMFTGLLFGFYAETASGLGFRV